MWSSPLVRGTAKFFLIRFPQLVNFHLPRYLVVEPTNTCNIKCPLCPTPHKMERAKGIMNIETFQKILDRIDWKPKLMNFAFSGEPLVNPMLYQMAYRAWQRGIPSTVDTNAVLLERYIGDILDSRLQYITIEVDGANQEAHGRYRVGSDLEKVLKGARLLCDEKRKRKSKSPVVSLQTIVTRYNEDQIPELIGTAREIGADRMILKSMNLNMGSWLTEEEKGRYAEEFLPTTPRFRRYDLQDGRVRFIKDPAFVCPFPLDRMVILWTGEAILCCLDFNGRHVIGNIFEKPLSEIWRSQAYQEYRKQVWSGTLDICKGCHFSEMHNEIVSFNGEVGPVDDT